MEALGQVGGTTVPSKFHAAVFLCGSDVITCSWLQDGCCILAAFPRGPGKEQRVKVIVEAPVLLHQISSYISLGNTGLYDETNVVSGKGLRKEIFFHWEYCFSDKLGFS